MRRVAGFAVALLVTGCSERADPPATGGHQLAAAGSGGQAGTGASGEQAGNGGLPAADGAGTGGSAGAMGTANAGAAGAPLTLSPAPSVNLTICNRVADDGRPNPAGACFLCCAGANLINSGFFAGTCACASESADGSVCASEPDSDACAACCSDGSFRGTSFSPGPPTSCTCHGHTNGEICAPYGSSDCAVCCINAGYVSSLIDGACVCTDG